MLVIDLAQRFASSGLYASDLCDFMSSAALLTLGLLGVDVLAQVPAAFAYFNEVHPYSALKMRSLRVFRCSGGVRPIRRCMANRARGRECGGKAT